MKRQSAIIIAILVTVFGLTPAFAAEAELSGIVDIQATDGSRIDVPVKVSASIHLGEIQNVEWWPQTDCIGGFDREGDCREVSEQYWTPVVKVGVESAVFVVEIAGHQFQIRPQNDFAFIRSHCIANEKSLRVYGTVEPQSFDGEIVLKANCGVDIEVSEFVRIEGFLGHESASTLTKTVLGLNVVPAKEETLILAKGGSLNLGIFVTGNERVLAPSNVSWVNIGPIYSQFLGRWSSDNFQTYLTQLK